MPVLLLTGFCAWGDHAVNPSQELVESANPALPKGWSLRKACLPVSWTHTVPAFFKALTPDTGAILAFGLAAGRKSIQPERFARNAAAGLDGEGCPPPTCVLEKDGPASVTSTLRVDDLVEALNREKIPAEASDDAGDYLCNALSYAFLCHLEKQSQRIPAGFIHLPRETWLGPTERLRVLDVVIATALGHTPGR